MEVTLSVGVAARTAGAVHSVAPTVQIVGSGTDRARPAGD
jgi:hypothetical protein